MKAAHSALAAIDHELYVEWKIACSAPTQLEAARYLYDQGYGKAMQAVAVNSNQVVEHVVRDDIDARLESRIALIRARLREQGVLPQ
jgi:hypothetical protein